MALAAVPVGLALGLSLGLLGGGGSVLAVPLLVYVLGESAQDATTSSLAIVAAAAVGGGLGHARAGRVCWRHAAIFSAAALPGIVAGTAAADGISERGLLAAFAVVMLLAAGAIWRTAGLSAVELTGAPCAGCPPLRPLPVMVAGAAIGAMTGFFGIGGGFLIVPTLVAALALSMRLAVGTSLAIIAATSLVALAVHAGAGRDVDPVITLTVTVASVIGAVAGAELAGRVPQRRLARAFAVLVVGVATYLLVSTAVLGGPPGGS